MKPPFSNNTESEKSVPCSNTSSTATFLLMSISMEIHLVWYVDLFIFLSFPVILSKLY